MFIYMNFQHDFDEALGDELVTRGHANVAALSGISRFALLFDNDERKVPARPYTVHLSDVMKAHSTAPWDLALAEVVERFRNGQEIAPYLSTQTQRVEKLDKLLLHWGINHLHLNPIATIGPSGFVQRSDHLLFFRVHEDEVYLIDVMRHSAPDVFSEPDLVETVDRNWPHLHLALRGGGMVSALTAADHKRLRRVNVMTMIQTARGAVMPTRGVSTAGHSLEAVLAYDRTAIRLRSLQRHVQYYYETLFPAPGGVVSAISLAAVEEAAFVVRDGLTGKFARFSNEQLDR